MIPLLAMQFDSSGEVNWSVFDFMFMGLLLSACQLAYVLMSSRFKSLAYKSALAMAILVIFLLVWVNAAVGIIGNENNPANLMYLGVILLGIAGAWVSRLQAKGMALTLLFCCLAMVLVGILTWYLSSGVQRSDLLRDILFLSGFFCALMLVAAGLFLAAAQQGSLRDS